jgi:two-component system sensor histidine kinase YcbA
MSKLQRAKPYIMIALFDAFMTQIYIDLFTDNFRISVAVLLLPIIYFFNRRFNPLVAAMYIGGFGLLTRTMIGLGSFGTLGAAFLADYHIFFFDITYGLIYFFFLYKKKDYGVTQWLVVVLVADLMGNVIELLFRSGFYDITVFSDQIYILFYVAIFRTIIAIVIVLIIQSYQMFILKNEHNQRYKRLLLRVADLESELYFIDKNMVLIEEVMYDAYDLYEGAETMGKADFKAKSLVISKDIHEIKKNYVSIYDGIKEIVEKDKKTQDLYMHDLMNILFNAIRRDAERREVNLKHHINSNFVVRESFHFISIIRNILLNSVESFKKSDEIKHSIILTERNDEKTYTYVIIDNGPGIPESELENIFEAGYSTKFDDESGDANRGLGLYIVKELIETFYHGSIEVKSEVGKGTEIILIIPKSELEVAQ